MNRKEYSTGKSLTIFDMPTSYNRLSDFIFSSFCSYVMASYASFLWDAEEEDDDIEEENKSSLPAMPVHETLSSQALVSTPLLASV